MNLRAKIPKVRRKVKVPPSQIQTDRSKEIPRKEKHKRKPEVEQLTE